MQTGLVLQVGSNPEINIVLEVGQVTEQIEVQANAALVETRNTGVGQVIDNARVLELPLNGRQINHSEELSQSTAPHLSFQEIMSETIRRIVTLFATAIRFSRLHCNLMTVLGRTSL